jgi:hypothetical protein
MYSAVPAFALLGGWGLAEAARALAGRRLVARVSVTVVLAAALALSLLVGFGSFLKKADRTYARSLTYKRVADYMNGRMSSSGRLMLRVNDLSPNLAFYLKVYRPDSILLLPDEPGAKERDLWQRYSIVLVGRNTSLDTAREHIAMVKPEFVMIRPGFTADDGADLAIGLEGFARPVDLDGVWVFDGRELSIVFGDGANP